MKLAVSILLGLVAGCSTSSTTTSPPDAGADATATDGGTTDGSTTDGPPGGACVVRPACQPCLADAGACCTSPNPVPPPEVTVVCGACAADAGPTSVTLGCTGADGECSAGDVCCIEKDANGVIRTFCAATCTGNLPQAQVCDTNAAVTACPASAPCSKASSDAWQIPHCMGTCGGVPPPP